MQMISDATQPIWIPKAEKGGKGQSESKKKLIIAGTDV